MAILITIIVIAVVLIAAVAGWSSYSRRRLRTSFGPEVETVARQQGSARDVDRELRRRKKEHDALPLREISPEDQAYYATSWQNLQAEFLDDPSLALAGAEKLVAAVLTARGYPGDDQEEQLALLSVEHADSLAGYRAAQSTVRRAREEPSAASTEELRQAMLAHLALFDELLTDRGARPETTAERPINLPATDGQEANR
ncbi:MAG TPA: hypothetical protein VFN97_28345 [Actinospica sp.]|nr:hypothetical protein [Actinospica sp.]